MKHKKLIPAVEGDQSCSAKTKTVASNANIRTAEYANTHLESKRSLEGVFACNRRLTNQNQEICIPAEICKGRKKKFRRCSQYVNSSREIQNTSNLSNKNMINSPEKHDQLTSAIVNTSTHSGDVNLNVVLNRLNQPPSVSSVSSDSDFELVPPEIIDQKQTNSKKSNTIISFPHQFPGLSYPLVQNNKWIYSIVPSDSKVVRKFDHPESLSLKLVEANLEKDPIMKTTRDAIRDKNPRAKEIFTRLGQYYAQHYNDFAVRENGLWMDGRLAIPKDMSSAVLNRLHFNHHGRDKMITAAKDVWIPLMHRNLAATAKYCKSCLEAGKNLKPDIPKSEMGEMYVPKEPNDLVQLDFWGPVNYVRGRKKYVLVAVDALWHCPSAIVCSSNKSKNVSKFLRKYINTNGQPRKLHMDQATGFFSNEIQNFCNYEGIELIKSPVKDHRATGMVERTIGSIKITCLLISRKIKITSLG